MSTSLINMKQIWFAEEATFGVDPDATGAGYKAIYGQDVEFTPTQDSIDRPLQNGSLTKVGNLIGAKGGTITFAAEVRGTGIGAGDGIDADHGEVGELLEAVCGNVRFGTGTTCSAAWTTTSGAVVDATGLNVGDVVMINGQARRIVSMVGSTITLNRALSAAPAESDVVYAAANYIPADSGHKSISFVVTIGAFEYTLTGCKGTMEFAGMTANGRAMFNFTFQVDSWVATTKASLPSINPTLYPKGAVVLSAEFSYGSTHLPISEFGFGLNNTVEGQPTTYSATGRSNFIVTDRNAAGSFKPFFSDDLQAAYANSESKELLFPIGKTPSNCVAIAIPVAELDALPVMENVNNQTYANATFKVCQSGNTSPDWVIAVF